MMKKRLFSALLALVLLLSLLPAQVFAYLGGVPQSLTQREAATKTPEAIIDGSRVYSLTMNGGQLKFSLALDGDHAGKSVTASVRSGLSFAESVANGVYEQARFTLQTGKRQKALKIAKAELLREEPEDMPISLDNALVVRYTFSGYGSTDPEVECYVSYYFVKLAPGATDGKVPNDAEYLEGSTHTYALVAHAIWKTASDNTWPYVFRYFQDYHGFSRMGHGSLTESAAHVKLTRTYEKTVEGAQTYTTKSTDITTGLGRTTLGQTYGKGSIAEIYSDSYGVDSPFVLADYALFRASRQDVFPPIYMTYNVASDCLIAEGNTDVLGGPGGIDQMSAYHVWGFRDVYTKAEAAASSDVKFTDPDRVDIPQDADKLGFYKTEDSIAVAAITDAAQEIVLKKRYGGDPLYILRGDFEKKSDHYEFTDKKVALTSTITATWSGTEHFRVYVNGDGLFDRFDVTSQVQYSTPAFKLYSASEGAPEAALAFAENVLTLAMDPAHNEVIAFVDLPEVECKIDSAQFQTDGDLVLSGKLGLDFLLNCGENSMFELDKIGYGTKTETSGGTTTSSFVQKGISASGEVSTGSLIGLDLAAINAKINTFDGEESYAFSLEINAFDLFETEAQLELKRLNNGRLVPNDLYFFFAMQPGIPIAPPVPTAFLRGGGGGFFGLADTINGDYIAIPPMRLKFTAAGDYVKVVKGRLHITIGPSYLEYAGTNLEFAGANIIDEFNMHLRLVGEKRSYQGINYTGLRAGGGMGITIKAPEDIEVFEIASSVEASMFGALDNYSDPEWAYIQLDSRGSVVGKVKIPKKVGKYEFKIIGGYTLASAGVDFILGGQTAIPVSSGTSLTQVMEDGLKNLSVYGGLSHTGNLGTMHWRVFYVLPKHFGGAFSLVSDINKDWSLEDEIEENNWYVTGGTDTQSLDWPQSEVYALCDENGEQVGLAVMENSLYELPVETGTTDDGIALFAAQTSSGHYEETVTVDASTTGNYSDLLLKVFPAEGSTVADLRSSLKITSGSEIALEDAAVIDGVFTNPDTANCTVITEDEKDGLLISTGLNNKAPHTITIEADCDFTYDLMGSACPTELGLALNGYQATGEIRNARSNKTYAVRYYFDTQEDREGEHYFLGMAETAPFSYTIPQTGTLAPTGSYYVTAVLVEKVTGDFNGDGTVGEDEYSWVTVDTKTLGALLDYQNELQPNAPTNVDLQFTGNETLTASWNKVDEATGYRVSLYYQDSNGSWKQAGASYELDSTEFGSKTQPSATVDEQNGTFSLRMAPTVSGTAMTANVSEDGTNTTLSKSGSDSDEAPTNTNYKVEVEAYKDEASADGVLSSRYYSTAAQSGDMYLPKYTPIALEVLYGDEDQYSITLDGTNGYGTLTWNKLPENGYLFKVSAKNVVDNVTINVEPEQGSGSLEINDLGHVTAKDAKAKALVENGGRVKLTATKGSDVTTYYLRLILDDVAPILTLDSASVAADQTTGKYTVTGTTEPGLTVKLVTEDGDDINIIATATADAKGRFAIQNTLPQDTVTSLDENGNTISVNDGYKSLIADVTTQDAAGNAADPAAVVITARAPDPDDSDTPVTPVTPVTPGDGGSSYTPGNSVTVEKTEHGSVSVDPKTASAGATVTVTVTPDKGYTLEKLTVTDQSGKELPLTNKGGGKYTFTMPSGRVTVKAAFMEDNSMLNFFVDVKASDYFYDAVLWAAQNGITSGTDAVHFSPNAPCTRAQIVTFLWRAAGSPEPKGTAGFKDVSAGSYYAKAVAWAVENGITDGTGDDTFSPDSVCTRAQAVTFLARALGGQASGKAAFSDVPSGSYYADAVAWAAETGVTTGIGGEKFAPDRDCTRAQIVTFLYRAYQGR